MVPEHPDKTALMNSSRRLLLVLLLAEILITISVAMAYGVNVEALQASTRFSGRLSFAFFCIIFLFSAVKPPVLDRGYLTFAVIHTIHLFQVGLFVSISGTELIPLRLAGGAAGYFVIFSAAYVEHQSRYGKIHQRWFKRTEFLFHSYIWLLFLLTYIPRVNGTLPNAGGSYWEHVALLLVVISLPIIRMTRQVTLMPAREH